MSWEDIRSNLITTITRHADFSCNTVQADHARVLSSGKSPCVTIEFGGVARSDFTLRKERRDWTAVVDVYTRWRGDIQLTNQASSSDSQKLIDTLGQWPRLGNPSSVDILSSLVSDITPIEPVDPSRSNYVRQRVTVIISEIVEPNRQEDS